MAISKHAGGTVQVGSTSLTITGCTATQDTDIVLMFVFHKGTGTPSISGNTGWALLASQTSTSGSLWVYWKVAGATNGDASVTGLTSSSSGGMASMSGVDVREPFFYTHANHRTILAAAAENASNIPYNNGDWFDNLTTSYWVLCITGIDNDNVCSTPNIYDTSGTYAGISETLGQNYTQLGTDNTGYWTTDAVPSYFAGTNVSGFTTANTEQSSGSSNMASLLAVLRPAEGTVPVASGLTDDFNDNSIDGTKWTAYDSGADADVVEAAGEMILRSFTSGQTSMLVGNALRDLAGSAVYLKVTDAPESAGYWYLAMSPHKMHTVGSTFPLSQGVCAWANGGNLYLGYGTGWTMLSSSSYAINWTDTPWVQLSMDSTNVYVHTSPNGTDWTQRASIARSNLGGWTGYGYPVLWMYNFAASYEAKHDNWSTTGGPPTQQIAGTLSATATLTAAAVISESAGATLAVTATLTSGLSKAIGVAGALSATATLASTIGFIQSVGATLAATATLTSTASRTQGLAGTLASTATLTAAGVRTQPIVGGLSATATLTSDLVASYPVAGTLASTATLTAGGIRTQPISGDLSATATLTATETVEHTVSGTLAATATLTAVGALTLPIAGGLAVTATLTSGSAAIYTLAGVLTVTATLTSDLDITAGFKAIDGTLAVSATLTAGGLREVRAEGGLTATTTLAADGLRTVALEGSLITTSTLAADVELTREISGTLSVTASLVSELLPERLVTGGLTGTADLTAEVTREAIVEGGLAATATLAAGAEVGAKEITGTLVITATLASTFLPERLVAGGLASTATLTASATESYVLDGTLVSTATLSAGLLPTRLIAGGLSATATLTSDLVASHPVEASLAAIATLTTGAEREAPVVATLSATALLTTTADRTATFDGTLAVTATLTSAVLVEHPFAGTLVITATLTTEIWTPLITVIGTPQTGTAPGNENVTLVFDITPIEGDVTVLIGGHYSRGVAGPVTSGYSVAHYNSSSEPYFGVWYKRQGVSPDSSVDGQGSGTASDVSAYVSYVLRGVDSSTPLDAVAVGAAGLDPPPLDTVTVGAVAIAATGLSRSADQTPGSVAGYSNVVVAAG